MIAVEREKVLIVLGAAGFRHDVTAALPALTRNPTVLARIVLEPLTPSTVAIANGPPEGCCRQVALGNDAVDVTFAKHPPSSLAPEDRPRGVKNAGGAIAQEVEAERRGGERLRLDLVGRPAFGDAAVVGLSERPLDRDDLCRDKPGRGVVRAVLFDQRLGQRPLPTR